MAGAEPKEQWLVRKLKRCQSQLRSYRRDEWQPNQFREALRSEYWRGHEEGQREAGAKLKARLRALEDIIQLAGLPLPEQHGD